MSVPTLNNTVLHPMTDWDWIYVKTYLSLWLEVPDDVLHVHAGLLLMTAAALVLRRPPWDWRCWLAAAIPESANELYDVFQTAYSTDEGNWASAWHDWWMTMLWPTVVLLAYRWLARRGEHHPNSD